MSCSESNPSMRSSMHRSPGLHLDAGLRLVAALHEHRLRATGCVDEHELARRMPGSLKRWTLPRGRNTTSQVDAVKVSSPGCSTRATRSVAQESQGLLHEKGVVLEDAAMPGIGVDAQLGVRE